ncbi:MAG: ribonuclease HI, partial [Thermomicrobiales bacterium]
MAVIRALELEQEADLVVFSDSMVTVRCARGEYNRHSNLDLWERFEQALNGRGKRGLYTSFRHVKGHHTNPFNNLADRLAAEHARRNFALLETPPAGIRTDVRILGGEPFPSSQTRTVCPSEGQN